MLKDNPEPSGNRQDNEVVNTDSGRANQNNRAGPFVSLLLGSLIGVSIASQVLSLAFASYWLVLGFIGFIALGVFITYHLLRKIVIPLLRNYSPKNRLLWVSICMLAGFFLVLTMPLMVYPKPQVVQFTATGEKNANSKGSEVWLNSIITGSRAAPVHISDCKGDWLLTYNALVSYQEWQPSKLICTIGTTEDIYIDLGMHPWSGKVRLNFEGQNIREDLYSAEAGAGKQIILEVTTSRLDQIIWLLLFIADGVTIGFLLLAMTLWGANLHFVPAKAEKPMIVRWYWFGLALFSSWMLYLLVFWPGFFTPDSVFQFSQILSGRYTNWHPAFHTMVLGLTTRLWLSPTPAILLQIILLSGVLGWGLSMIASQGTPKWVAWMITFFLAFSPGIALILLNPWKDVAYSIALVAMVLMIFYLINYDGVKPGLGFWLIFGVVTSLVALFRLNGALVAFGSLLALMVFDHRRWKSYLPTLVLSTSIFLVVTGPFYRMMNVNVNAGEQGENLGPYYRVLSLVMTHDKAGTFFPPGERAVLSQFVLQNNTYSTGVVAKHKNDLLQMALSATARNPSVTLEFFLAKSRFIFQILQPPRERIEHVGIGIYTNPYGFTPDPKLPFLQPFFLKIDSLTESPVLDWLFWRNAFWMFLLIISGTIACIRLKTWKYLVVILPVVLNAIPLLGAGGGQISRYIYATLLLGPLFGIGLFFIQPAQSIYDKSGKLDLSESYRQVP